MSFNFIRDHAGRWPVRLMCRVLEVSASGYYAWRNRPESARAAANRALLADLRRLHAEHHGRYGSPGMHAALRAERQDGEPRSGSQADAQAWHPRACRPQVQALHDRQPPLPAGGAERVAAGVRRGRAEPRPARRHHLHRDWRRMALPCRRARLGDPQDRRLVDARPHAHRVAACRADDGRAAAKTGRRPHLPFRSRQPIRVRGIFQAARHHEGDVFDEPHRLLLRQCSNGELLPYAQSRTRPSATMGNPRAGPQGSVRLHRELL